MAPRGLAKGKQAPKPAEAPAKTIWYLLVDHQRQLSFGACAEIAVQADTNVDHLRKRIKEDKPNDLRPFDANTLEVWTYKHKNFSPLSLFNKLQKIVSRINFLKGGKNLKQLSPGQKISKIDLPEDGMLLVRVNPPQTTDPAGGVDENGDSVLSSELFQQYKAIFIYVASWDGFRRSDLRSNKLRLRQSPPNFVVEFRQKLDSKPALSPDVRGWFRSSLSLPPDQDLDVNNVVKCIIPDSPSRAAYFEPGEASTDQWRHAELSEVMHVRELACVRWEELWQEPYGHGLNEDVANSIFFHRFILGVPEDEKTVAKLNKYLWPLRTIVNRSAEPVHKRLRDYTHRSDFLIATSTLPRLLVEISSTRWQPWPRDLIRMLLSGAFVVRFSNEFLEQFRTEKQFVLVAIFIQQTGEATRYLLYQLANNSDQAVYYTTDNFNLNSPIGRVEFARQLYNFLSVLGEEGEFTMTPIQQLNDKISDYKEQYGMKSFMTKKSKREDGHENDGDGAGAGAGVGGASAVDSEDLRAHGYEVKSDVMVDAKGGTFEPFFKMPPNILTVFRRSDPNKQFIAKKVREESHELEILKVLNNFQPRSEHIISLLDSFQVQSRTWAILPEMDSVKDYILGAPGELSEHIGQICWGLIKGLAYLHGHRIAHRDIKPDNLLVRREDFCLKVIDFDLAMNVKDEDEEVDGKCGTEGWMAPEVEARSSMYSPIRADRWSCGQVIIHLLNKFRKKDEALSGIAKNLKAHSPRDRPSLLEWQISSALPVLDSAKGRRAEKRKASRPRQDIIKVDGGEGLNTKKKRRLAI